MYTPQVVCAVKWGSCLTRDELRVQQTGPARATIHSIEVVTARDSSAVQAGARQVCRTMEMGLRIDAPSVPATDHVSSRVPESSSEPHREQGQVRLCARDEPSRQLRRSGGARRRTPDSLKYAFERGPRRYTGRAA